MCKRILYYSTLYIACCKYRYTRIILQCIWRHTIRYKKQYNRRQQKNKISREGVNKFHSGYLLLYIIVTYSLYLLTKYNLQLKGQWEKGECQI